MDTVQLCKVTTKKTQFPAPESLAAYVSYVQDFSES